MLVYPNIDPVAIALGPVEMRWYGLLYVTAYFLGHYLIAWQVAKHLGLSRKSYAFWDKKRIGDIMFYALIFSIIGGRLGEMFYYQFDRWMADFFLVFRVWEGGLSFHGGIVVVPLTLFYYAKRHKISVLQTFDLFIMVLCMGIVCVRIGNFINSELWGIPTTTVPWAMLVEQGGRYVALHPTQLYQALVGLLVFFVPPMLIKKNLPHGLTAAYCVMLLGTGRFIIEFFKQHDPQYDVIFAWFSTGHLLAIVSIVVAAVAAFFIQKKS